MIEKKKILFIWQERDESFAHILIEEPLTESWQSQLDASETIWRRLVKRGVII